MKIIRTMDLLYKTSATISEKCENIKWFKTSGILYIISKSLTGIWIKYTGKVYEASQQINFWSLLEGIEVLITEQQKIIMADAQRMPIELYQNRI